MATDREGMWPAGMVLFAGAMLMVTGLVNIFQGFVALFDDDKLVLTPEHLLVVNTTGWGWVLMGSGLLLMAVGGGLFTTSTWARIVAIIVVALHALSQFAWFDAYPIWAIMMFALDIAILWALTVGWSAARSRIEGDEPPWRAAEPDVPRPDVTRPAKSPVSGDSVSR
ncbi:hypothetical protein [Kribbella sp. NPDC048915]|uniref:DUF7144 family membrane protein n=1 Tax=Kribbella sp. NPDC048915 TaxID=3155148 RepID=UPI0033CA2449